MAVTKTTISNPLAATLILDSEANATSEDGVLGQASLFYFVEIDNTLNTHVTYVKLAKDASVTVGTSAPHWIFPVPAATKITYVVGAGFYTTNISFWAVQEAAASGTTAPENAVSVEILAT